jgi:hypothetical protein
MVGRKFSTEWTESMVGRKFSTEWTESMVGGRKFNSSYKISFLLYSNVYKENN